jgi:hypothetical protein
VAQTSRESVDFTRARCRCSRGNPRATRCACVSFLFFVRERCWLRGGVGVDIGSCKGRWRCGAVRCGLAAWAKKQGEGYQLARTVLLGRELQSRSASGRTVTGTSTQDDSHLSNKNWTKFHAHSHVQTSSLLHAPAPEADRPHCSAPHEGRELPCGPRE